jgi:hypothetical protein
MKLRSLATAVLAAASLGATAQSLYRWVDTDGRVHYSDRPPPKEIKKVEQPRLDASTISTSGLSYAAQEAARHFPVTLYTAPDCSAECAQAREFLAARGVPFREQSIVGAEDAAAFRKALGTDKLFLPSLTVGSQKSQGFEEGSWGGLLDAAGYPRSAPPAAATKRAPAPAGK